MLKNLLECFYESAILSTTLLTPTVGLRYSEFFTRVKYNFIENTLSSEW